ncbi:MAG TPA: hypothetical protein VLM05_01490, partial [Mycobacteriales bacterium]|nr:hypothetical protein [Mycobacteriales bacterium]
PAPGGAVVATPLGLWLPGHLDRLAWHLIDKATWQGGILTIIPAVDSGDGVLVEQPPRAVRLDTPRDIPQTVRVRVQKAIAFTRHHPLPGQESRPGARRGVRVVGRRVPGHDGVSWQLVFDGGVDRDDPAVRAAAAAYVEQARVELGL